MLYIVPTPIGNFEDITLRALRVLKEVDMVLAEDTRKTGILLAHFQIKKPLESFYEHNEVKKIPWVIAQLKAGKNIALVSNAGTPTMSDPGYKLIRALREEAIPLSSLPGASSITTALSASALPHDKFIFLGYLPRKSGARNKLLASVKDWGLALIFFESPHRLTYSLAALKEILGNRKIAIAREISKKFEQFLEFTLDEAIDYFKKTAPKGEFTIIVDKLDPR